MIILKHADDIGIQLKKIKAATSSIGFVPTMGALHKGHISLLQKSKEVCEITICSIFINPTQFNNADDFKKYPVTLEQDIYALEKNGCDILFLPDVNEIYPGETISKNHFNLGYLETILEGKYRPGHFQGVCQVVSRLLKIVAPTHLFIGQKDYQQCMVIKRLIELEGLNIELIICPTLREENGLAMSSRNLRLDEQQREEAAEIYKTLLGMQQKIKPGSLHHLKKEATEYLIKKNFNPDYIEIAEAGNLNPVNEWDGTAHLVALAAAFIGDVRLIDNILLKH
ncbi:MAG: pantoate--beta-alanine ligase [Chitinophagaceae bacterium]|nr:pantoate--beta-alanine ligase [Chitinophagaceae bacterium]